MLSMITSALGGVWAKLALAAAALALVGALGWAAKHYYTAAVEAQDALAMAKAANATLQAQAAQFNQAFTEYQQRSAASSARAARTRSVIYAAPVTRSCASSPAVAAALAGLRPLGAAGGQPAGAGGATDLPAPAGAAGH